MVRHAGVGVAVSVDVILGVVVGVGVNVDVLLAVADKVHVGIPDGPAST